MTEQLDTKKRTITATVYLDQFERGTQGKCDENVATKQIPVTREVVRQGTIHCAASPVVEAYLYSAEYVGIEWPVAKLEDGGYRLALPCAKTIEMYRNKIRAAKEDAERDFKVTMDYKIDAKNHKSIRVRVEGIAHFVQDKLRKDESLCGGGHYLATVESNSVTQALVHRLQDEAISPGQMMLMEVYHTIALLETFNVAEEH